MCYEHMKKSGECPICDADEAVNSIDWLDSKMTDRDEIKVNDHAVFYYDNEGELKQLSTWVTKQRAEELMTSKSWFSDDVEYRNKIILKKVGMKS